jgi:hypothetical protein
MNGAATPYPIHTVSQACHHVIPSCTADDTIIHLRSHHQPAPTTTGKQNTHVLTLNESAIQLQRVRYLPKAVKGAAPTRSQS